ncbi:V-set and transmembrane domain-containing protein 2-like protein [Triplophysa tibetana]|uniref:V-set and transmembrane domain-containing protein 2-like protein n=1 Tax=Triplophysa tibetana TaxID=1572043 RepID=A0A5A9NX39_9TELE|nr:V-set and transmembrane domain-containing protein 2-like protein [Triplophysa tibetana]
MLFSPMSASVGVYTLSLRIETHVSVRTHLLCHFSLLCNPWCEGDSVFLNSEEQRDEYVMRDFGLLFKGTADNPCGSPWLFDQGQLPGLFGPMKTLDRSEASGPFGEVKVKERDDLSHRNRAQTFKYEISFSEYTRSEDLVNLAVVAQDIETGERTMASKEFRIHSPTLSIQIKNENSVIPYMEQVGMVTFLSPFTIPAYGELKITSSGILRERISLTVHHGETIRIPFQFTPRRTALFTEVPHDIMSRAGENVELKCSFRGARSSSVSLEIQWWYARYGQDWPENPGLVGSNISHKLRLSSIKPSDEGTYKCRVIDFSESQAQQHSVQAYVQVQPADLLQQEHTQLQNKGRDLHMDQKQYWRNHQLKDGEHKNKSNKVKSGDEDHRMIHNEIAAQMRQEMDHQFRKVDLQHHHKVNKTRAGNEPQPESRELL